MFITIKYFFYFEAIKHKFMGNLRPCGYKMASDNHWYRFVDETKTFDEGTQSRVQYNLHEVLFDPKRSKVGSHWRKYLDFPMQNI